MTNRLRVAALELKSSRYRLPLAARAWLGHPLTPAERAQAAQDAAQPIVTVNWSSMSKEAREWLQA